MLWYKSWLETRWRFFTGLGVVMLSTGATVLLYPQLASMMESAPPPRFTGVLGERIAEALAMSREFRGYVWSEIFRNNLATQWSLFAVVIGTGGLVSQVTRGGGGMFMLSLPVSRQRLAGIRAATGLAELLALALVPALLVPLLAPAIGESYRLGDALVHSLCLFAAGSVFFSLAFLLSAIFADLWRPLMIVLALALGLGFCEQVFRELSQYSVFGVMSAQRYFRGAGIPWVGLIATVTISAMLLRAAAVTLARRDF